MVKMSQDTLLEDVEISSSGEESDCDEADKIKKQKKHQKLLNDLDESLGNKKRKQFTASRSEPSAEISEYNWSTNTEKVSLQDLVGSLDSSKCKSVAKVKKKLQKMEMKARVLDKPLEKVQKERVERSVAFEETAKDVSKWNATIQKNREEEQLTFPMASYKPPAASTKNMVLKFKPQNEMEKQINAVLHGSKHLLERKDKELTEVEEKALESVDLEEALERRKELQKTRALQSYYEAKCHRVKKIKSKKYHRMLKKAQKKELSKVDLEALAKENPELFASEMEKVEKLRAKERASLRHGNTSKWAKNLITRGNKSKEEQERVREQLRIGRQLTEHQNIAEQSDDDENNENGEREPGEEDSANQLPLLMKTDGDGEDNPWLLGNDNSQENINEGEEEGKEYKKLQAITTEETIPMQDDHDDEVSSGDEWEKAGKYVKPSKKKVKCIERKKGKIVDALPKKKKVKCSERKKVEESSVHVSSVSMVNGVVAAISEEEEGEEEEVGEVSCAEKLKRICKSAKLHNNTTKKDSKLTSTVTGEKESSDSKILNEETKSLKEDKNFIEMDEDDDDSTDDEGFTLDNTEQARNISEAFANDDVVAEFLQEKKDAIEKAKPKPVDLTLPGWGDWAGPGLTVSKRKRKRFTKDMGGGRQRKDDNIAHLIINEKANENFVKHQVTGVPFPYTNKVEFERSIRQPIGQQWNTPSIHNKLIEPKIRITPGTSIEPMKASKRMKRKFMKENPK